MVEVLERRCPHHIPLIFLVRVVGHLVGHDDASLCIQ
jgi:hypothetical protein